MKKEQENIGEKKARNFRELLKNSGLTITQLANMTNLSPSHIEKFESGNIQSPGRNTLIYLALHLCMDKDCTDEFLASFGEDEVARGDEAYFLEASQRRKITGIQPLFDRRLSFDTLLLNVECLDGDEKMVHNLLSSRFKPEGYQTFRKTQRGINDPIFNDIGESLLLKRRQRLKENLENGYRVTHLICSKCLKDYMERLKDTDNNEERRYIRGHIKNTLEFLEKYPGFNLSLITECSHFSFEIKELPSIEAAGSKKKENRTKLFFHGNQKHEETSSTEFALQGFCTDSPQLVKFYSNEFARLEKKKDGDYEDKKAVIKYLAYFA